MSEADLGNSLQASSTGLVSEIVRVLLLKHSSQRSFLTVYNRRLTNPGFTVQKDILSSVGTLYGVQRLWSARFCSCIVHASFIRKFCKKLLSF